MSGGWSLAFRNLGRNRRRNAATAFAVGLGYAGLVLLCGYVLRWERVLSSRAIYLQHAGSVSVYKKGGLENHAVFPDRYGIDPAERAAIGRALAQWDDVEYVGAYLKGMGLIGNGCRSLPFFGTGIDPELEPKLRAQPDVLRWNEDMLHFPAGRGVWEYQGFHAVGLTKGLALLLGKKAVLDEVKPGKALAAAFPDCGKPDGDGAFAADANVQLLASTFGGRFNAIDAEVTNHYSSGMALAEDSGLTGTLGAFQELFGTDKVSYLAVYLRDHGKAAALARALPAMAAAQGVEVEAFPYTDARVSPFYVGSMGFLKAMGAFFLILISGVVTLSVVNSLTMTVLERGREIGTLRALGFMPGRIGAVFVREQLLLAAQSLAAGAGLAWIVKEVVNRAGIRFRAPGFPGSSLFLLTPNAAIYLILAGFILTLVALTTAIAVRRFARRNAATLLSSTYS